MSFKVTMAALYFIYESVFLSDYCKNLYCYLEDLTSDANSVNCESWVKRWNKWKNGLQLVQVAAKLKPKVKKFALKALSKIERMNEMSKADSLID